MPVATDDMLQEAADGFFLAAEHGRSDVIKALADHGEGKLDLARIVDPATGRSPLHVAVANRKTDALRVLLMAGFPPNVEGTSVAGDHMKRTPYALAVDMKAHDLLFVFHQFAIQQVAVDSVDGVSQLLSSGVPLTMTDGGQRQSLLHWAVTCRANGVLRFLLELPAAAEAKLVDQVNVDGATPLHFACRDGVLEFVRLLLRHHANPRCTGTDGAFKDKTPVDFVTSSEIRALVEANQEERQRISRPGSASSSTSASNDEEPTAAVRRSSFPRGEDIAGIHRHYQLQLEEKDLLVRQLRTTIEALVVEAQEIRKLGEERTVLDYIRKLREEKDIVRRQLEDSEDHIRMQQQQIQELKRQIRQMASPQDTEDRHVGNTFEPNEFTAAVSEAVESNGTLNHAGAANGEIDGYEVNPSAHSTTHPDHVNTGTVDKPANGSKVSTPPSLPLPRPPRSSDGPWGGVWDALWGSSPSADGVDADGEIIMTV